MSNKYLVFSGCRDRQGGAKDFDGCFDSLEEAINWGEAASGLLEYPQMGLWSHIAELNLATNQLKLVAIRIPETQLYSIVSPERQSECDDSGEWQPWRSPRRKG